MKREKQTIIIIIVLLFLSLFSTTPISIDFETSQNVIEQVLEENNTDTEKDDKFFKEFFCKLFSNTKDTKSFSSHTISYSHLEIITPFRPPILS
jgi:hypothetical protein